MATAILLCLMLLFGGMAFLLFSVAKGPLLEIQVLILLMCAVMCAIGAFLLYRIGVLIDALKTEQPHQPPAHEGE